MKLAAALIALSWPVLALAQAGPNDDPATAFRDTKDQIERDHALGQHGNDRDARLAVAEYGKCTVRREPGEARRLVTMDFNATGYASSLKALSRDAERNCALDAVGLGTMRSDGLLFAGAIAEALLDADSTPLNARLARASAAKVASFAPSDALAQCLARSLPDNVSALLATEPESAAEKAAAQPLLQAVPACSRVAGIAKRIELSVPALRATVATASYRLVSAQVAS